MALAPIHQDHHNLRSWGNSRVSSLGGCAQEILIDTHSRGCLAIANFLAWSETRNGQEHLEPNTSLRGRSAER
jgi:hypothetical protein